MKKRWTTRLDANGLRGLEGIGRCHGGLTERCTVLVVEDFVAFRRFICSTLQDEGNFHVIGEAADGLEAVQKAAELNPDLILLDIGLPTLNGIEAARRISAVAPASKIIFVSQHRDPDVVRAALNDGACGYIFKSRAGVELVKAIAAVLRRERFVSRSAEASETA